MTLARAPWLRGPLLGATLGFPLLGVGGRLAMRAIALQLGQVPSLTPSGTTTVLLAGTVSGLAGGAIYAVLYRFVRPRVARELLFAAALLFLTLRGLHPVRPMPLALFGPCVALWAVLLVRLWPRGSSVPILAARADAVRD